MKTAHSTRFAHLPAAPLCNSRNGSQALKKLSVPDCGLQVAPTRRRRTSNLQPVTCNSSHTRLGCGLAVLLLLLLCPALLSASPSSALRDYKAGKYDEALKQYEQLLKKKGDDPRLHFNAGAAAYRNRQFDEATKQFDQAVASPDLKLQQLGYYNRGNALFYQGEQNPDPKQRSEAWEKSLKDYDLSLKLNPQDADAKFNRAFVKKMLEKLKKQQQQQQSQQNKSGQQKQDQKQQQQNQQNQQSKQDQKQQQQQQAQQDQPKQKQDSSAQNSRDQKKQDQQQQQAANQAQAEKQKQQQQQASGQKQENAEKKQDAAAYAAGQMTPEQARQLLDAQKGQEKMLSSKQEAKPVNPNRPIRDW